MFLLNRSKLVRDPAFADDEVIDGGSVSSTPGGMYLTLGVLLGGTGHMPSAPSQGPAGISAS